MIPNITILKPAPGDRVHGPFEVRFRALTKDNPKKIGNAVY
jgi:hypothetical protein